RRFRYAGVTQQGPLPPSMAPAALGRPWPSGFPTQCPPFFLHRGYPGGAKLASGRRLERSGDRDVGNEP
ncbi:MAG TPA: hypothetical protein VF325_04635, partial [Candidatus Deferrimicrobium sp.]